MDRRSLLQQSCKISGKRLPSEYARVEYLESTGTQYIDTGVESEKNLTVESTFSLTSKNNSGASVVLGCGSSSSYYMPFIYWQDKLQCNIGSSYWVAYLDPAEINEQYHISFETTSNMIIVAVNQSKTFTAEYTGSLPHKIIYLFGGNYNNSFANEFRGKIYSTSLKVDGTLVRYFVPALRLSDMKPGLYDLANDQFYVNQGTGEFLYGPYVEPLPDVPGDYQKVEYIESTGTQWIDSGYAASSNYSLEFKGDFDSNGYFIAYYRTSPDSAYLPGLYNEGIRFQFGYTYSQAIAKPVAEHTYKFVISGTNGSMYVDDELKATIKNSSYAPSSTWSFYIFASHDGNRAYNLVSAKLYYCKFSNDSTIVRNFIPCYRKADGEIGLFDLIKGVFYTNQGTGTFLKGPDVN